MAWTLVQSVAQTTNGTATYSSTTAGNLLIAVCGCSSTTAITPPAGWTSVVTITGTASEVTIFANFNNPGGITGVTFTGGASPLSVSLAEFTCPGVANVVAASATGTNTANKVASVTVTNGAGEIAGDLVIVGATQHITAAAITWTDPAGFTEFTTLVVASAAQHTFAARELSGTGASQAATVTSSVTSTANGSWTGVIASFTQPEVVKPLRGPVTPGSTSSGPADNSAVRLPPRGWIASRAGVVTSTAVVSGPPVYPLQGPVGSKSRQALPSRGRASGIAGVFDYVPAVFVPPSAPSGVRVIQLRVGTAQSTPPYVPPAAPVTAAPAALPSLPGLTWLRRFRHRQAVPVAPPVTAPTVGPPVYPLHGPVGPGGTSQGPTDVSGFHAPQRGRVSSNKGVFGQLGPPVYPLRGPVTSGSSAAGPADNSAIPAPRRGRVSSSKGIFGQLGPPVYPMRGPVTPGSTSAGPSDNSAVRLPPRGRISSRTGTFGQLGPPVYPMRGPVTPGSTSAGPADNSAVRLPPRGQVRTAAGIFDGLGPTVRQLHGPVAAVVRPLPVSGRIASRAGVFTSTAPLPAPAALPGLTWRRRFRHPQAVPAAPGVVAPITFGPPVYPLQHPVQARVPLSRTLGKTAGRAGIFQGTGPLVRQLPGPVAAVVRPLPARGRIRTAAGAYGGLGPAVRALAGPVRAAWPAVARTVRAVTRTGTFGGTGPPLTPLRGPVQAKPPLTRLLGRASGRSGVFTAVAPAQPGIPPSLPGLTWLRRFRHRQAVPVFPAAAAAPVTGPPVNPLQGPVRSRVPAPPRPGIAVGRAGPFQGTGAVPIPLHQPVRVIRPAVAYRNGSASSRTGPFSGTGPAVRPLGRPVSIRRPYPPRPGSASGRAGIFTPGTPGPPVYPLRGPVRAVYPQLHPRAGGTALKTLPYVLPSPASLTSYPYNGQLVASRWQARMGTGAMWDAILIRRTQAN